MRNEAQINVSVICLIRLMAIWATVGILSACDMVTPIYEASPQTISPKEVANDPARFRGQVVLWELENYKAERVGGAIGNHFRIRGTVSGVQVVVEADYGPNFSACFPNGTGTNGRKIQVKGKLKGDRESVFRDWKTFFDPLPKDAVFVGPGWPVACLGQFRSKETRVEKKEKRDKPLLVVESSPLQNKVLLICSFIWIICLVYAVIRNRRNVPPILANTALSIFLAVVCYSIPALVVIILLLIYAFLVETANPGRDIGTVWEFALWGRFTGLWSWSIVVPILSTFFFFMVGRFGSRRFCEQCGAYASAPQKNTGGNWTCKYCGFGDN